MTSFLDKIKYKKIHSESENDDNTAQNDENKKPAEKAAIRGKAAALLANLDDSDDNDDSDDDNIPLSKNRFMGIYRNKINQAKKEKKNINTQFHAVENNLLIERENENTKKSTFKDDDSIDTIDSNDDKDNKSDSDSDTSIDHCKKKKFTKDDSPAPASPPPPPSALAKPKRKSTSVVDRQLKELEMVKNKAERNRLLNDSYRGVQNTDDDDINTITVRVSTKNGLHKWELNENQAFKYVFEQVALIEKCKIENLVLMLKERIIGFNDTPESINLKIYDIIDCGKTTSVVQERIRVVENEDDSETHAGMLMIILQTQDGRKSRVRLLVSKDEKFGNVLKKYCEKKSLEFGLFIMEFDGDKVKLDETPEDLDLDGGEIFDVRKSSKPALEQIQANTKNYDFDDDILIA